MTLNSDFVSPCKYRGFGSSNGLYIGYFIKTYLLLNYYFSSI